jgi:TRAP-type C4-dicarboxylate transport system substrate-binding protein
MDTTKLRRSLVAIVALGLATAGFGTAAGPPDKSGGSGGAPVQLTLLNENDTLSGEPAVQRFVDRVNELSRGALTINVDNLNDGSASPEVGIVREVQSGKAQLAWVGTRVWDLFGVRSFAALSAPMLVDSYPLQAAVLRSDLPQKMLAGLDGHGLVGLAVLGDNIRYPAAARPIRGPEDFRDLRIRSYSSATQMAAMRALGAHPFPVGWPLVQSAFQSGKLSALEIDLNTYQANGYSAFAPYVTLNVPLWPRTTVIFANSAALAGLSAEQRAWIDQAAAEASKYALTTFGEDKLIVPAECRNGMKGVLASADQLAALRKAFAPVYASLRRDPATAAAIDEIEALKKQVGSVRPLAVPRGCGAGSALQFDETAAFPQGVFRTMHSRADVLRAWPNIDPVMLKLFVGSATWRFKDGTFDVVNDGGLPDCRHADGRYFIQGPYMVNQWLDFHGCHLFQAPTTTLKLRWTYDGKNLRFSLGEPALPPNILSWTATPFVRIG